MVKLCLRILLAFSIFPACLFAQGSEPSTAQTTSSTAASVAPSPVRYTPQGNPILEDGTPIRLRLSRTLSSADCKVGDRIDFEVLAPVVLDGITVIPQGGIAWGTVTDAEHKRRMGRGGKLAIEITAVKLANFGRASLRAEKEASGGSHAAVMGGAMVGTAIVFLPAAPLFLLMHGKDVKIPAGTEVTAYVNGDTPYVPAAPAPAAMAQPAAPEPAAPAPEPPPEPVPPPSAADAPTTELTLTSTPDGADIEVDGAFVGNTPSTIPLASGEHTVRVSKKGFRPYEKTLHTSGGNINLRAELDPAGQ